jgi:hypothetical protein
MNHHARRPCCQTVFGICGQGKQQLLAMVGITSTVLQRCSHSPATLRQSMEKALIMFDLRRCPKFLAGHSAHPLPLFNLTNISFLMDAVTFQKEDAVEC